MSNRARNNKTRHPKYAYKKKTNCIQYNHSKCPEDYLEQRLDKSGDCWVWLGGFDQDGYGQCSGKHTLGESRSHRLAYKVWVGNIPNGLLVCHKCDNPKCCNPAHLFLGTPQDNMDDMVNKGRQKSGCKSKFDESLVVKLSETHTSQEVADLIGCSYSNVCHIWRKHGITGSKRSKNRRV